MKPTEKLRFDPSFPVSRLATNDSQTVVWRWDSDAFGTTLPDEDPDGDLSATTVNLRFPGQYFDAETGFHYNYFRTYDPSTGRYVESDPIGLGGGRNTYAYVTSNPVGLIDIDGLKGGTAPGIRPLNNPPRNQQGRNSRFSQEAIMRESLARTQYNSQQAREVRARQHQRDMLQRIEQQFREQVARAERNNEILENLPDVVDSLVQTIQDLASRSLLPDQRILSFDPNELTGIIDGALSCSVVTLTNSELHPSKQ